MKREMLKSYEAPLTRRTQVALESGICAASANVSEKGNAKIDAHEVNTSFSGDFSESAWDTNE